MSTTWQNTDSSDDVRGQLFWAYVLGRAVYDVLTTATDDKPKGTNGAGTNQRGILQ